MPLIHHRYGKGRVRVMRIHREGEKHEVRELTVQAMVEGEFARAYTSADNSACVSTDTIKNVVNVVARENLALDNEMFCKAVADKLLSCYPQVESAVVSGHQTKWTRLGFGGVPHPHGFVLDANGKPFGEVRATRSATSFVSGVAGYTFMKSTESGWAGYVRDPYTTIVETDDRICATAMDARWEWSRIPADFAAANETILSTMIEVFAGTYSSSVQDTLYRMGEAALAAVPEISKVSLACPNKHYLLVNLAPFNLDNANQVFLPTDEPHGQIECTVGR
jgi:urate oxidase